jgi:hypothetical protein
MRWTPTHAEAELLVDMLTARLPAARIAQRLNIDVATLRSYMAGLAAAEDAPYPEVTLPPQAMRGAG